jgi:cytochrome c553
MKKTVLASLVFFGFSMPILAEEVSIEHGKQLHDQSCVACHANMRNGDADSLYTRSNRRVKNIDSLQAQVRRCESNLELKWFDEDILSVSEYLNSTFYKF